MTTTLEQIVATKRREVAEARELYPAKLLERSMFFTGPCVSLKEYLARPDYLGVIAEIKRRSPSKGVINQYISVEQLSVGYMQAGASALSILTDTTFFGGKAEDLTTARRYNFCPILRKDFIIDGYQVLEAKSLGADVVLLIAAALSPDEVRCLGRTARSLGLEVLLEVHTEEELSSHLCDEVDLVGVNNRDLATFTVDIGISERLAPKIPSRFTKIAESGISDPATLRRLRECGYRGFLIGEAFMRASKPDEACRSFIERCVESV
jgi:indole-3-glycerol phosphate synthase